LGLFSDVEINKNEKNNQGFLSTKDKAKGEKFVYSDPLSKEGIFFGNTFSSEAKPVV